MLTHLPLFDSVFLASLTNEFRRSMRALLADLCRELADQPAERRRLPLGLFRRLGTALDLDDFSHWRVVGWIEELNDLVYFVDVHRQLAHERDRVGFAEAFLEACQDQFYENSYLDDLFPRGEPQAARLPQRLAHLCQRLRTQVTAEALCLVPGLPCGWVEEARRLRWSLRVPVAGNMERAEPAGFLALGLDGLLVRPRVPWPPCQHVSVQVRCRRIDIRRPGPARPLLVDGSLASDHWRVVEPAELRIGGETRVTVGPTLRYSAGRVPTSVSRTPASVPARLARAFAVLEQAWPEGAKSVAALTSRIIPLRAPGVVSYSYRHRPGLSFINCFERDDVDLIDDLVHETSHHHLNLLLRKARLIRGDHHEEIFYSPWRRSLRPLRGILHATFTFTMGAVLFERLASSGLLSGNDAARARFRCVEEIDSVRFSLTDLRDADRHLGWLTPVGRALVEALGRELRRVERRAAALESRVRRSAYAGPLLRHRQALHAAREQYGRRRRT